MNDMNATDLFSINPDASYTLIDDEAVLMGDADDTLYAINDVGTEILKHLEKQPMSVLSLANCISEQFDVDKNQCTLDVTSFIESLLSHHFIVPATR